MIANMAKKQGKTIKSKSFCSNYYLVHLLCLAFLGHSLEGAVTVHFVRGSGEDILSVWDGEHNGPTEKIIQWSIWKPNTRSWQLNILVSFVDITLVMDITLVIVSILFFSFGLPKYNYLHMLRQWIWVRPVCMLSLYYIYCIFILVWMFVSPSRFLCWNPDSNLILWERDLVGD